MFVLLYAVASTFVACRNEPAAPATAATTAGQTQTAAGAPKDVKNVKVDTKVPLRPPVISKCVLGADLAMGGVVEQPRTAFTSKESIYVSMWLNEAPEGLTVSLKVYDQKDKTVTRVQVPAGGKKTVTMKVHPPLKPGRYRIESFWGGNSVCEHDIQVRK